MTRLGGPLDVLDHRFGAGPALTVGVEEEFMLLDRQSLDLVQQVERILAAERRGAFAELVSEELFESLIELIRPYARASRRSSASCAGCALMALRSPTARACGSARPARIPSACSSASA
jgi:hypothetical protein